MGTGLPEPSVGVRKLENKNYLSSDKTDKAVRRVRGGLLNKDLISRYCKRVLLRRMASRTKERAEANRERTSIREKERRASNSKGERDRNMQKMRKYRSSIKKTDVGAQNDGYLHFGALKHVCAHCEALHWLYERSKTAGSSSKSPRFSK